MREKEKSILSKLHNVVLIIAYEMFKPRKGAKQFRKKTAEEEIAENQADSNNGRALEETQTSTKDEETEFVSIKQRKKQEKTNEESTKAAAQKAIKPSLLSFDDEIATATDKQETTKKEAKPKRKLLMTGMIAASSTPTLQTASKIYSTYTPEMLQKLKEGTKVFPPAKPKSDENGEEEIVPQEENDQIQDMDVEVQSEENKIPSDANILNTDQVENLEMAEDEEDEEYQRWERFVISSSNFLHRFNFPR